MAEQVTGAGNQHELVPPRIAEVARAATVDVQRAIELAAGAKADGLADPLLNRLVAIGLRQAGRFEEAIAELGLGLALDPQNAQLMTDVGFCLLELGRRREAGQVLGVAVKLAPASAETNFAYGWAAQSVGSLNVADSAFKRAIALDPNHADTLAGLSGLAAGRREWDAARSYAERAAAIDPRQTDALMNLARIDLGQGHLEAAETQLRRIIELRHLKPQARAASRILLGDTLDAAGRYREALDAYAEGKSELREQFAHIFDAPQTNSASDGARRILSEFLETPPEAWSSRARATSAGPARAHAFLVGFPRSGTTLLEQVLASHPDVVALDERPALIDAEEEFLIQAGGVKRLAGVVGALLEPFRQAYWKRVGEFGVNPASKVFIDKHPLSTARLPLISKIFPQAKIIFAIRDPRDVVLSCFRRNFNMNAAMYEFNTLDGAAKSYDTLMTAAQVYFERLPVEMFQLRYEALVSNFEGEARRLCEFLGIDWTEAMKDFATTASTRLIATPSGSQVARGLYTEGAGQWRNYAFALEPVMPILQPWIEKFGYDPA
jgi:tetratricopeptide (TPR) repeat protein